MKVSAVGVATTVNVPLNADGVAPPIVTELPAVNGATVRVGMKPCAVEVACAVVLLVVPGDPDLEIATTDVRFFLGALEGLPDAVAVQTLSPEPTAWARVTPANLYCR